MENNYLMMHKSRLEKTSSIINSSIRELNAEKLDMLDIGCSTGMLLTMIQNENESLNLYGVDKLKKSVREANKKGINAKVVDLNSQHLPFANNKFDIVICLEVIEHLCNPDLCLSEIGRVLKKGGILFISTPNLASWRNRLLLLSGRTPTTLDISLSRPVTDFPFLKSKEVAGHVRNYTLTGMCALLNYYGFKIKKIYGLKIFVGSKLLYLFDSLATLYPSLATYDLILAYK